MRRLAAARKLMTRKQTDADVSHLIEAHNIDIVCNITRTLLTEGIFESTLKSMIRFPEVFDVSPAQSADREVSEAEAAINDANGIKGAVKDYSGNIQEPISRADTCHNAEPSAIRSTSAIPSLFPVYLPLRTQHRILTKVQGILEDACFDFGQRIMPDSELLEKVDNTGEPLAKLLTSVANIRHTAVHRIYISAGGLGQLLLNADTFAAPLRDTTRLKSLTEVRRNIQQTIEELERNKHLLTSKLGETLKNIAAKRAGLDRIEEMALADMMSKILEEVFVMSKGTL
ncbi:hypothetical protein F5Y09DRAFT_331045 [Xylaria sp. FL1042]|nr:hypothetical protein F5Y09DRAFT_331045 [Xylaria sp. FL1042]